MLKFELPLQWQTDASYLMNQRTFALLMTMSDTPRGPISTASPDGAPGFQIAGLPIRIVSQLSDVAPGSTPIAFGNSHPILNWWCYKIPRYGSIAWG